MKKDYRIKIPYNLKKPFGDYRSVGSLIQYFNLHSVEDASINTVIPNLANRSGKPCVGSQIGLIGDTPFQKMVKYSVNLEATTNSYYRIEYGNQTDQPFTNNDEAFSISLWVRLPNLRVAVPDNESVIFNKILAGEPSANWSTSGEMALTYMSGDATFRFELAGQEGLSSPGTMTDTTLTFSSKPINTLDNVKFRDGEWVHVVVVKKRGIPSTDPGGQSLIFDNTLSYIDPWIKIYINGQDATDTSSGAVTGYNAGTASQPVMFKFKPNSKQGDITLGRGKGDDGTSTDNTACGLYDFAVWRSELSKESIKEIWSRSQYHQGSGLLTVSPKVQIRKEVNREAPYLSARNTPRVNLPNKPFNDNDSFIFKPTTIPNQSFQIDTFALTTNRSRIGLETPGNFKGHRIFSERPAEVLPNVNGALSFNRWLYASPVIQTWDIQSVIKGTVTEIQTLASSDVRNFDRVIIRDAKGISGVNNQYFYAQNVSSTNFKLFHDPNLTIPVDTSTSDNHAPNTGIVYVESAKYLDLFEDFYKTKPALKLSGNIDQAQQTSPCEIDTVEPHGLSDGSQIYIENVGGMTELDGNLYFVKVIGPSSFHLYGDSTLLTPIDATGFSAHTSGGDWQEEWLNSGSKSLTIKRPLENLQYPINLAYNNGGDQYRKNLTGSLLSSPNVMPDIVAPGSESFYIVENYYDESVQPDLYALNKPFNDSLVLPNGSGKFFGATKSIGGFTKKVRDKTQIIVELPLNETSEVTRYSTQWDNPTVKNYDGSSAINPHYGGSDGRFFGKEKTGFLYYNKSRGAWEQKGLNDVVGEYDIPLEDIVQHTTFQEILLETQDPPMFASASLMNSGSSHIMRLFYPGGTTDKKGQYYGQSALVPGDLSNLDQELAKNIGYPMLSNYAPNANQYFATSSQTIKMSDYISEPFLLEKVILEIPDATANKTFDYPGNASSDGAARPQDDYVFFLMRQWRRLQPQESNLSDSDFSKERLSNIVSSSMRYIICSGSACFYNDKRTIPGNTPASGYADWSPYNTPSFSHNFGKELDGSVDIMNMSYNGPISLPMVPAVASKKTLGNYFLPGWDGTSELYITQSDWQRNVISTSSFGEPGWLFPAVINASWPGGTTTVPLDGALTGSRKDINSVKLNQASKLLGSTYYYGKGIDETIFDERTFFEINPNRGSAANQNKFKIIDARSFRTHGAGATQERPQSSGTDFSTQISSSWAAGFPDKLELRNAESPYLLFPEDELVLGLDAAIGLTARMAAGVTSEAVDQGGIKVSDPAYIRGANNLTGSFLTINSGKPMILRLYGSLVKDQIQAPDYPKLDITQPDITDTIIGGHVLDQYDIALKSENSGSYRERLLTGSLTVLDEGGTRKPNPGTGVYSEAIARPFYMKAAEASAGYSNTFGTNPRRWTPDNSTVITASIPSGITGYTYGAGHALAGQPLEKIYIRFYVDGGEYTTVDNTGSRYGWRSRQINSNTGFDFWASYYGWPAGFGTYLYQQQWTDTRQTGQIAPDEWIIRLGYRGSAFEAGWENNVDNENSFAYAMNLAFTGIGNWYNYWTVRKGVDVGGNMDQSKGYIDPTPGIEIEDVGSGVIKLIVTGDPTLGNKITFEEGRVENGQDNFYITQSIAPQTVNSISQAATCSITTSGDHQLAYGQMVSVTATTSPPFSYFDGASSLFAKPTGTNTFELYLDNQLRYGVSTTMISLGSPSYSILGTTEQLTIPAPANSTLLTGSEYNIIPNGFSGVEGGLISINPIREVAATDNRGNLGEFGSFQRFSRHVNSNEVYYDSAVPSLVDVWKCLDSTPTEINILDFSAGGQLPYDTDEFKVLLYGISAGGAYLGTGEGGFEGSGVGQLTGSGTPYSADWWGAFPFEPKFQQVPPPDGASEEISPEKVQRRFGPSAVTDNEGRVGTAVYWITNDVYKGWGQAYSNSLSGSLGFDWQELVNGPSSTIGQTDASFGNAQVGLMVTMDNQTYGMQPSYNDLAQSSLKVFYGIGDGPGNLIKSSPEDYLYPTSDSYSGLSGSSDSNGNYPNYYKLLRRAKKPRGWKYGLINALPQRMSAVYRSDSYGQFRDMLEGRPYAVVQVKGSSEENNYNVAPVEVKFVKPTWSHHNPTTLEVVHPVLTRSSNLSPFATSSLPYFDSWGVYGDYPFGRDRPEEIRTVDLELIFPDETD